MIFNLIRTAKELLFNNSGTGLKATNVQDAITAIAGESAGYVTAYADYVSNAPQVNNGYTKCGRIVFYALDFTLSKSYSDTKTPIFTGLPKPKKQLFGILLNTSTGDTYRILINGDGAVIHGWGATIPAGGYILSGTYISAE